MELVNGHGPRRNGNLNGHGPARPRPLGDAAAARLVWRVANGAELTEQQLDRLDPAWQDAALLAVDDGPGFVDEWLAQVRAVRPERFEAIEAALGSARIAPDDAPDPDDADGGPGDDAIDFGIIDSEEFAAATYVLTFLITGILVEGQPCIVGGPRKALKTSLLVEMAICLAAGVRFLDRFEVPRPRKVLFLSGESGEATLRETARRICEARGVDLAGLKGWLNWGFTLPKLSDPRHLEALAEIIRANGIEVVVIDPLYLCLLNGGAPGVKRDAANIFDMGPLLVTITATILGAGATPVLAHHLRKNRDNPDAPPELEDLAFAGVQEFARQWVLLGRRTPYEPGTGEHQLWLSVGGSAGHSGGWALDVSEGVVDDDFQGRRWETRLSVASQARQEAREQAVAAKAEKSADRERMRAEAKLKELAEHCGVALAKLAEMEDAEGRKGYATESRWRGAIGLGSAKMKDAAERLLARGKIERVEFPVHCGPRGIQPVWGYRLIPEDEHPTTPDHTRPNDARSPVPGGPEDTRPAGVSPPLKGGDPDGSGVSGSGQGGPGEHPTDHTRPNGFRSGVAGRCLTPEGEGIDGPDPDDSEGGERW